MLEWQVEGTLAKAERDAVIAALAHCDGCVSGAAARLRVGRSTLYRMMAAFEIDSLLRVPRRYSRHLSPPTDSTLCAVSEVKQPQQGSNAAQTAHRGTMGSKVILKDGIWLLVSA